MDTKIAFVDASQSASQQSSSGQGSDSPPDDASLPFSCHLSIAPSAFHGAAKECFRIKHTAMASFPSSSLSSLLR